ncbi:DUF4118 domain-containing protein [Mycobacterium sp. 1274761.0]|uniref:sensor histidine kinase n=1 Tax=Mycobacterium sp. 1274761.0 TaxID=1834077 RepID=UPI0009EE4BFD|nr:DUF4118 domain-containing protein [Mycobacterium sp. 1274761.0]
MLFRPTPAPAGVGVVVALGFIAVETLLVYRFKHTSSENSYGAIFLLGVLVISVGWGFGLSLATTILSALIYCYFHLEGRGSGEGIAVNDFFALFVFLPIALITNVIGRQARLRAYEADALATQQAALRQVATMVARGISPEKVSEAAVYELCTSLDVDNSVLLRFEDHVAHVVGASSGSRDRLLMSPGERLCLHGDSVAALIKQSGHAARVDNYDGAVGPTAARIRQLGIRSAVGAPIIVDDCVYGALIVGSARSELLPPDTELWVGDFADLVATAIINAATRAELTASRARIVSAADQARRRFERDLHDGAQQSVVSLGLQLRSIEAAMPADQQALRQQIADVMAELSATAENLREISRGLHPAVLSEGGLRPALNALARRSALPVVLDVQVGSRFSQQVEVAAYYAVAEALTNASKHAHASEVSVRVTAGDGELHLLIADDGVGGATIGGGSGLIGLKDRVEALGGRFELSSPVGGGTSLRAVIPCA